MTVLKLTPIKSFISPERIFMISALLVNAGNYLYNLVLGRLLGPDLFADAAILITFLLILSFIAMTLQLSVAKFTGSFSELKKAAFLKYSRRWAGITGTIIGLVIIAGADLLQTWFQTDSAMMFRIFGIGVPVYFLLSVNRGNFQGEQEFIKLSFTYQGEMLSRLVLTLLFIWLLPFKSSELVAAGILLSFIPAIFPFRKVKTEGLPKINSEDLSLLKKFIAVTAFYELTQILINNGDILLVKHYFSSGDAGLYASLALVGRAVYFVAWMFVMILLPKVVQLKKEGIDTTRILLNNLLQIGILAGTVVLSMAVFPELLVKLLFGEAYLEISGLLWKYALASSLFALANVFVYYFLSLESYFPVLISGIFGMLQLFGIILWHESLENVVHIQIYLMLSLLLFQVFIFIKRKDFRIHRN